MIRCPERAVQVRCVTITPCASTFAFTQIDRAALAGRLRKRDPSQLCSSKLQGCHP